MVSQLCMQKRIDQHGERHAILQHDARVVVTIDLTQGTNNRRNSTRVAHRSDVPVASPRRKLSRCGITIEPRLRQLIHRLHREFVGGCVMQG